MLFINSFTSELTAIVAWMNWLGHRIRYKVSPHSLVHKLDKSWLLTDYSILKNRQNISLTKRCLKITQKTVAYTGDRVSDPVVFSCIIFLISLGPDPVFKFFWIRIWFQPPQNLEQKSAERAQKVFFLYLHHAWKKIHERRQPKNYTCRLGEFFLCFWFDFVNFTSFFATLHRF